MVILPVQSDLLLPLSRSNEDFNPTDRKEAKEVISSDSITSPITLIHSRTKKFGMELLRRGFFKLSEELERKGATIFQSI